MPRRRARANRNPEADGATGPALSELLGKPLGSPEVTEWTGTIFWASAMSGGFFGLIGGWLTDRFGRRRVLVFSILLYAFSAFAAGFSTSVEMLLVLRCTTHRRLHRVRRRRRLARRALPRAAPARAGARVHPGVLVDRRSHGHGSQCAGREVRRGPAGDLRPASRLALHAHLGRDPRHPAFHHPALPPRVARLAREESGGDVAAAAIRRALRARVPSHDAGHGADVRLQLRRGLRRHPARPDADRAGASGGEQAPAAGGERAPEDRGAPGGDASHARRRHRAPEHRGRGRDLEGERKSLLGRANQAPNQAQFFQEIGGLLGRFTLAFLAVRIVSRRRLLRVFQAPGLIIVPLVFLFPARNDFELFKWGILAAGFFTVAQFSFWGNYLPRMYPVHLRGTGESFAANVGGRMLGTSAAFFTTRLAGILPVDGTVYEKLAYAAAITAFLVYAVGSLAGFWLPEPKSQELPE